MFITPRIFGNRYVLGQQKTQTPAPVVSSTKPKAYSSIYDQPSTPKTAPQGAIGQRSDGSYITQPQPKVTTPQVQPSATDTYLKNIQDRGQSRIGEQQKTLGDYLTAIKEQNEIRRQESEAQKADEEAKYGKFVERTKSGAQDVANASIGLKEVTKENYGQSLKQGAQAGREQEALLTNRFANSNTIDSSAFQNAMINSKAGLVGGQQSILNEQARSLTKIDNDVFKAQKDAQDLIDDEGVKLQATLRGINNTYANGSIEYRQAVAEAYKLANENINSIKDNLDQLSYNAEQEKLKLGNSDNLSEEFLKTGVPVTMNDLIFRQKNPDKAKGIYEQATAQGTGNKKSESATKALDIATRLKNISPQGIAGITGNVRFGLSNDSRTAQGLLAQLTSELQLEEAARMKGQGSMTESERQILRDAIAGFNLDGNGKSRLSPEAFNAELDRLMIGLEGKGGVKPITTVTAPDGTQIEIID